MMSTLMEQVSAILAQFTSVTRLYELEIGDDASPANTSLLVEAFAADDAVDGVGAHDVIALSTSAQLDLASLLGQPASLVVSLADGTRTRFAGEISAAAMLGSDGGFARYRVRISPWLWRLAHVRNSRVWQDKSVTEIVDEVFKEYQPLARWRWSDESSSFLDGVPARSYCCQYRETDLDFIRRLLAEEGLCWRFEQTDDGPGVVVFADSSQLSAVPDDPSSEMDAGIRFHGTSAVERGDTVQALQAQRRLHAGSSTMLSHDYKAKRVVAANSPSRLEQGKNVPLLEVFDAPGAYAFADGGLAQRYADLRMEAIEARSQMWRGRSTVRTLRAGTRLTVTGAPRGDLGESSAFTILRVTSIGVNNLPTKAQHALAELFGPIPELLQELTLDRAPDGLSLAIERAVKSGYANCFEAIAAEVPWRPSLSDGDGHGVVARPTVSGAQSAIVIGPDGGDTPNGADELYCDRLGRVRIRFHWQDSGNASCWVRVAQRSAGGGIGSQFLPRIGQEVLVQFLENDVDRPIIVGALYNGRGEGGVPSTPGGQSPTADAKANFDAAHDHAPSSQGNLAGGNSPVWHGASNDHAGHCNAAAQWGVRTKEFGGAGYNQLLFDDTDGQGRVQLRTTHATSELNLGHLIHSADNYRGSLRGLGAELRTDAYGAVRAGAGLLVSSYGIEHDASSRDPVGDNGQGIAMLKQAVKLAETFHEAAATHRTVGVAAHLGASGANASVLDDKAAPLKAVLAAVAGMVDQGSGGSAQGDAAATTAAGANGKLPYSTAPLITIAAKAGLGVNAAESMQLANGETVTLVSGQDTQFATGGQMRLHTGQAIGMLAGAVKAGTGGTGLQLIAAKDAVDVQAQSDRLDVQARDDVSVVSANAHVDWAAAKKISLSTADGANITIEGGNITVQCPGKIVIHAGKKSFTGPARIDYPLPRFSSGICEDCILKAAMQGSPFTPRTA